MTDSLRREMQSLFVSMGRSHLPFHEKVALIREIAARSGAISTNVTRTLLALDAPIANLVECVDAAIKHAAEIDKLARDLQVGDGVVDGVVTLWPLCYSREWGVQLESIRNGLMKFRSEVKKHQPGAIEAIAAIDAAPPTPQLPPLPPSEDR